MADPPKKKVKVRVREIVDDVKAGMKQDELVRKHRISPRALASVTEKILRAGHVSRSDLHPTLVTGIRSEKLAKKSSEAGTSGKFSVRLPESLLQSLSDKEMSADAEPIRSLPTDSELTSVIMKSLSEVVPSEKDLLDRIDQSLMMAMPSEKSILSRVQDAVTEAAPNDDLVRTEVRETLSRQLPNKEEILNAIASSFVFVLPDAEEIMKRVVSEIARSFSLENDLSGRVDDSVEDAHPSRAELLQAIDKKLSLLIPDAEAAEKVSERTSAILESLDEISRKAEMVLSEVSAPESAMDKQPESKGTVSVSERASARVPGRGSGPIPKSVHQVRLSLDDMGMLETDEDDGFEPTIELDDVSYRKWTVTAGHGGDGDRGPSDTSGGSPPTDSKAEVTEEKLRDTVTIDLGVDESALQEENPGPLELKKDLDDFDLTMSMEGESMYADAEIAAGEGPRESPSEHVAEPAQEPETATAIPATTTEPVKPQSEHEVEEAGEGDFSDDDIPTLELVTAEFPISGPVEDGTSVADSDNRESPESAVSQEAWVQELDCQLPAPPTNDDEADDRTNGDETVERESTQ